MKGSIKTLANDTIIYGLSSVLGRFLSFILTPIYTNYLLPVEYDFVIYSFSIVAFLNVIYALGMESAYFRFYNFENKEESKKAFTNSYITNNLIAIFITMFFLFSSQYFGYKIASNKISNPGFLFFVAMLMPMMDSLTYVPFAHLRMSRQAKKFAILKFLTILITVILNFVFLIYFQLQALGVFLAQIIGSSIAFFYFIPIIKDNILLNIDTKLFKNMLKFAIPTIPASLSSIILQVADRPILKELTQSEMAITTYQVNYRLGIPMMIFVTVFEYAFKPFYLSLIKESNIKETLSRIFTYFTLIGCLLFLIFSFFIEYLVRLPFIGGKLINPIYWDGLNIVPIILSAYFFNGLFVNFSAGFIIEKQTKYLPISVGIAAIVNIVANFILIPIYGYIGAAWATFLSYFVSMLILYILSRNVYSIKYEWKRVFLIIISTIIIFISNYLIVINFGDMEKFLTKVAFIFLFLFMLYIFGFFNRQEMSIIRNILKFKKNV